MSWFSARLLIVSIVDDGEPEDNCLCDYPFFVFQAMDEQEAIAKALQLGYEQEHTFRNEDGNDVRWAFAQIDQIWNLGDEIDGKEIGSLMDYWKPENPIMANHQFCPREAVPDFDYTNKDK
ncbi:DUF4288 domain-containing protein [Myxococcota bacterium]|nr:DUF4288 domain-containing protein [Myxococcota bacterium]